MHRSSCHDTIRRASVSRLQCFVLIAYRIILFLQGLTGEGAASKVPKVDDAKVDAAFNKYVDPECPTNDMITLNGVLSFCEDLEIDGETDIVVLVIAWKMGAKAMCQFTKEEWRTGFRKLGINTVAELKAKIPSLRTEILTESVFREFYLYCFTYALEEGQKTLTRETAAALWIIVLKDRASNVIQKWCDYLNGLTKGGTTFFLPPPSLEKCITSFSPHTSSTCINTKRSRSETPERDHYSYLPHILFAIMCILIVRYVGISKDTWTQFYEWSKTVKDGLDKHDDAGAWPSQIDDFVAEQAKAGKK
jgi:hypothetical protein